MARILHLISSNERRGAEVFASELAERLRQSGHVVRVIAIEPAMSGPVLDADVAGRHRLDLVGIWKVLAAAHWAEVVVSFGSTSLITGSLAARLCRRPFVYRNIGDPSVWGEARLANLRIGAPLRSAKGIVALYPGAALSLTERYGLDPQIIRVIPRGVSAERFAPQPPAERAAARGRLGLDADRRWMASVGALSPEKDPLFALEVLRRLPDDVGLAVAGSGPLAAAMAAAGESFGERLVLLGSLTDVRDLLAAADVLVLTSRTEGIPGAVIEAGLSGLPTVAHAVGGVPRTIDDGVSGRVVPLDAPDEFAAAVLDVLGSADAMGAAALAKCRAEYSMDTVAPAWQEVLRRVTGALPSSTSVLHVTASPARRGAETFAVDLSDAMGELGWSSWVAAVSGRPDAATLPVAILGERRFRPLTFLRLVRRCRAVDVVVAHGSNSLLMVAGAACVARRPYVYRVIGDPRYWGRVRLAGIRIGLPLQRADAVVVLTDTTRDWIVERYGVDPAAVVVSPNAVDPDRYPLASADERRAARTSFGLDSDGRVLGYVGALSPEKRPEWAVAVAQQLPDVQLLMAGEGEVRGSLERQAADGAAGRVTFLGAIADTTNFYAAIDALLVPSRTEGMPAVVIEAALSGVPVVATDVGAVRSVVDELGAGRVVDESDLDAYVAAVRATLDDPDRPAARRPDATFPYGMPAVVGAWAALLGRLASRPGAAPSRRLGRRAVA